MTTYSVDEIDQEIAAMEPASAAILRDAIERHHGSSFKAYRPASPLKAYRPDDASEVRASKAAAILAGAGNYTSYPDDENFLGAYKAWRVDGDYRAGEAVKAVLGTSAATGQAIVPNNFVAGIVDFAAGENVYRQLINYVNVGTIAAVDVPYDTDEISAALLQGAYGSNKDVRDFHFAEATATMYTIAQIADIGNQLLRQSNGAAEEHARRRLGRSLGIAESKFITAGTGSGQPLGFFQAIANTFHSDYSTALSSEPKAAALGRAIGVLESRGRKATGIVTSPTVYWSMVTETLGSNDEGGFAVLPGSTATAPQIGLWGVPIFRDPYWPSAQSGVALVGDFRGMEAYSDGEYRLDISNEAGDRWQQNVTGFRIETQFGFNATPYWLTGAIQKVTGL